MSSTNLAGHARKTHHPFELNDVKDLVRALQEPVAVFAYGNKDKSQNVIAEIQKDGKNFLVGIHFNQSRRNIEVSDIRGIFPKDNAEWLNWISQGKTLYLDKEKIQALIDQQRKTLAEVEYLDLDSITKLVNDFENPKLSEEENASAEQDLTNVSENETRFSKSNENQRIFVSNAEKAVEGIKQEKGTPEQWLNMIEKGGGLKAGEDKMLPLFMNKYGKKWGTKVGEVELPDVEEAGRTMWSVDVTPEMKESVMEGQTMFSKAMETDIDKAFNEKLSTLNDENKDKVVFNLGRPSKILLDAGCQISR